MTRVARSSTVTLMSCSACGHEDHGEAPCTACAANNGTCWQKIRVTGGDGDRAAAGVIDLAQGMEPRPCMNCKSFEMDRSRLEQHLLAQGLKPDALGMFETPIAKEFKGRRSLKLDPRNFGWCRKECSVVDMLATCPAWTPISTREDLASRIR